VFGNFLREGKALFAVPNLTVKKGLQPSILVAIGPDCSIRDRWNSKDRLEIRGASAGGRFIAVRAHDGGTKRLTYDTTAGRFLLVEPGSPKQVRLSLPAGHFIGRNAVFIDDDTQVFAAVQGPSLLYRDTTLPPPEARIQCWDVRTGKRTTQSRYIWRPLADSRGIRLLLTQGGGRIAVSDGGSDRAVWDAAANGVITWTLETDPRFQGAQFFVISPDGRLVLESGPGSVRVSQLP
jgi:hypothetical protein